MKPTIMVSDEESEKKIRDGFIYVPSIDLYVARKRSHQKLNWSEAHEALAEESSRMLTIPEFVKFLSYLKEDTSYDSKEVYNEITQVRIPWRAEWLDAYFEKREGSLHVLTENKTKAEKLEISLMKNKTPGISLESWISNPTSQGLPRSDVAEGDLYYWHPRDGSIARFYANSQGYSGLNCSRNQSFRSSALGVRAAK